MWRLGLNVDRGCGAGASVEVTDWGLWSGGAVQVRLRVRLYLGQTSTGAQSWGRRLPAAGWLGREIRAAVF